MVEKSLLAKLLYIPKLRILINLHFLIFLLILRLNINESA